MNKTNTTIITFGIIMLLVVGCQTSPTGNVVSTYGSSEEISTLEKVKSTREVRVGYAIYPPYIIKDLETGELSGYSIDLMNELTKQMKVTPVYVETNWQKYVADLKTDQYDLMVGPLFTTIERSMEIDFSQPYGYFSGLAAVVHEDDDRFDELEDLEQEGVTISVPHGWLAHEYSRAHLSKPKIKSFKQETAMLALADVIGGGADVGMADGPLTQQYLEQNPDLPIKGIFLENPPLVVAAGFGVKKGDTEWLQFLNTALTVLDTMGTTKRIADRYHMYSYEIEKKYVPQ